MCVYVCAAYKWLNVFNFIILLNLTLFQFYKDVSF